MNEIISTTSIFSPDFSTEEGFEDTRENSNNIAKNYCGDVERKRIGFVINYLKFLNFQSNFTFFGSIKAWVLLEAFKKPKQIQRNKTMDGLENSFADFQQQNLHIFSLESQILVLW